MTRTTSRKDSEQRKQLMQQQQMQQELTQIEEELKKLVEQEIKRDLVPKYVGLINGFLKDNTSFNRQKDDIYFDNVYVAPSSSSADNPEGQLCENLGLNISDMGIEKKLAESIFESLNTQKGPSIRYIRIGGTCYENYKAVLEALCAEDAAAEEAKEASAAAEAERAAVAEAERAAVAEAERAAAQEAAALAAALDEAAAKEAVRARAAEAAAVAAVAAVEAAEGARIAEQSAEVAAMVARYSSSAVDVDNLPADGSAAAKAAIANAADAVTEAKAAAAAAEVAAAAAAKDAKAAEGAAIEAEGAETLAIAEDAASRAEDLAATASERKNLACQLAVVAKEQEEQAAKAAKEASRRAEENRARAIEMNAEVDSVVNTILETNQDLINTHIQKGLDNLSRELDHDHEKKDLIQRIMKEVDGLFMSMEGNEKWVPIQSRVRKQMEEQVNSLIEEVAAAVAAAQEAQAAAEEAAADKNMNELLAGEKAEEARAEKKKKKKTQKNKKRKEEARKKKAAAKVADKEAEAKVAEAKEEASILAIIKSHDDSLVVNDDDGYDPFDEFENDDVVQWGGGRKELRQAAAHTPAAATTNDDEAAAAVAAAKAEKSAAVIAATTWLEDLFGGIRKLSQKKTKKNKKPEYIAEIQKKERVLKSAILVRLTFESDKNVNKAMIEDALEGIVKRTDCFIDEKVAEKIVELIRLPIDDASFDIKDLLKTAVQAQKETLQKKDSAALENQTSVNRRREAFIDCMNAMIEFMEQKKDPCLDPKIKFILNVEAVDCLIKESSRFEQDDRIRTIINKFATVAIQEIGSFCTLVTEESAVKLIENLTRLIEKFDTSGENKAIFLALNQAVKNADEKGDEIDLDKEIRAAQASVKADEDDAKKVGKEKLEDWRKKHNERSPRNVSTIPEWFRKSPEEEKKDLEDPLTLISGPAKKNRTRGKAKAAVKKAAAEQAAEEEQAVEEQAAAQNKAGRSITSQMMRRLSDAFRKWKDEPSSAENKAAAIAEYIVVENETDSQPLVSGLSETDGNIVLELREDPNGSNGISSAINNEAESAALVSSRQTVAAAEEAAAKAAEEAAAAAQGSIQVVASSAVESILETALSNVKDNDDRRELVIDLRHLHSTGETDGHSGLDLTGESNDPQRAEQGSDRIDSPNRSSLGGAAGAAAIAAAALPPMSMITHILFGYVNPRGGVASIPPVIPLSIWDEVRRSVGLTAGQNIFEDPTIYREAMNELMKLMPTSRRATSHPAPMIVATVQQRNWGELFRRATEMLTLNQDTCVKTMAALAAGMMMCNALWPSRRSSLESEDPPTLKK